MQRRVQGDLAAQHRAPVDRPKRKDRVADGAWGEALFDETLD
jgi:hypothetical protein